MKFVLQSHVRSKFHVYMKLYVLIKSRKKLTRVCGSRYHVTDGTVWRHDQEQAGVSVQHPTNHDRSNAGVIQSKRAVNLCLGVKRT